MLFEDKPTIEATLNELALNCYDLLGDIIAAQSLCACANLEDSYPADVIAFYRYRVADYMNQHSNELHLLAARACKQLHTKV